MKKQIVWDFGLLLLLMLAGDAETAEPPIQEMPASKNQRPRHNNRNFKPIGYPNSAGKYQGQTGNKKQKDVGKLFHPWQILRPAQGRLTKRGSADFFKPAAVPLDNN